MSERFSATKLLQKEIRGRTARERLRSDLDRSILQEDIAERGVIQERAGDLRVCLEELSFKFRRERSGCAFLTEIVPLLTGEGVNFNNAN